ncbi:CDP-alcohol phosphatidyltransferase family protein [Nocardioidaceae bacterium]|nr:CDP-alcohol phosphatidyltransferase family protein [Nocardioidaceae bacterium]
MLDAPVRRVIGPTLDAIAARLDRPALTPDRLTLAGLAAGLTSAGLAAATLWTPALVLWVASRVLDGLDGPLARRRASAISATSATADDTGDTGDTGDVIDHDSDAGGFLDLTCDFVSYAAGVVGVAVGVQVAGTGGGTGGGLVDLWPFLAVLVAYYLNGTSFLAFSSIAERTGHRLDDGRSFSFLGGLAEGTETVLVHSLWLLLPAYAPEIAWVWAVVVGISATQRVVGGYRTLRGPVDGPVSGR